MEKMVDQVQLQSEELAEASARQRENLQQKVEAIVELQRRLEQEKNRSRELRENCVEENSALLKQLEEKEAEFDTIEANLIALRKTHAQDDVALQEFERLQATSKSEKAELDSRLAELKRKFDNSRADLERAQQDLASIAAKNDELNGLLEKNRTQLESDNNNRAKFEALLQDTRREKEEEGRQYTDLVKELKRRIETQDATLTDKNEELSELSSELDKKDVALERLQGQREQSVAKEKYEKLEVLLQKERSNTKVHEEQLEDLSGALGEKDAALKRLQEESLAYEMQQTLLDEERARAREQAQRLGVVNEMLRSTKESYDRTERYTKERDALRFAKSFVGGSLLEISDEELNDDAFLKSILKGAQEGAISGDVEISGDGRVIFSNPKQGAAQSKRYKDVVNDLANLLKEKFGKELAEQKLNAALPNEAGLPNGNENADLLFDDDDGVTESFYTAPETDEKRKNTYISAAGILQQKST